MSVEVRVVDQKFYAKLNNGDNFTLNPSDFALHLKGGVLEEIKAVFNVQIGWFLKIGSESATLFHDDTLNTLRIEISGKDFINEGFSIGDDYKYNDIAWGYKGVITSISLGEMTMTVTSTSGLPDAGFSSPSEVTYLTGTTHKTALKYDFGLIENNESINFLSKLTNTEQSYLYEGISHNSPLTFVQGETQGNNKAAYSGSSQVAFVQYVLDKDEIQTELTTQEFQIEHIFKINPFYRDGELDSLKGVDVPPLDIFNGNMSLKYVFNTEFRTVLNNPNTSMSSSYDTQLGSVGYLDESYNGYKNNYSVENLVYTIGGNAVDQIEIGSVTNVGFNISAPQSTFTPTTPVIVGHTSIVDSLSYANSSDDYNTVWTDEELRTVAGLGAASGTLIKNLVVTYQDTSSLLVNFDVEFTGSQVSKLENNQDYLLYFTVQNPTLTVDTGDKVTGKIDVNFYLKNNDVAGLFDFDKFEQYPHPELFEEGVSVGFTDALTFNESGMMADGRFWVLNSATLNDLKFDVAVYKFSDDTWDSLRSLDIDLSDQVIVNGIQQIELDTTRGYVLKDGDIFNYLKITTDNNDGTKQYYNIQVGYRLPWQSWLEFKDAPDIFYDKTKSFNGLNQKASNYSMVDADYGIKVLFDATVDSTNYVKTSEEIKVYNYGEDDQDPNAFTCEIKTYNEDGTPIAGNIIKSEFTEVRSIFFPLVPPTFTESVDMTEVATVWNRFAHGEVLTSAGVNSLNRTTNWLLGQADDVDIFGDASGNTTNKLAAGLYTSTPNQILCNENNNAYYGCYSLDEYEYYSISGKMFSTANDNDSIGYVVAMNVDEDGLESSLSLLCTTGGASLGLNQNFDVNNPSSGLINSLETIGNPTPSASWALVYNYGKRDCEILDQFVTASPSNLNFNSALVGDLVFNVDRSSDQITIDVEWAIDSVNYTNTFNYNLFDNVKTEKFHSYQKIGFAFMSQDLGGFKDVLLTKPEGDFYSILRIDPKESQSDFTNNEISTFIEAPQNNLLKQITGDVKKATLSYDGNNFIAQCLVETSLVEKGQNYDFSTELRPLKLEL